MSIFVKKMCVLKQMKNGYSSDGGPLSGLVKAESYGNRLCCEVSLINFAPLSEGNYCLVLSDRAGETFSCPLRKEGGRCEANSAIDLTKGFLAVICYADIREYHAIAYGVNGENVYEIGSLLLKLFSFKKETFVSAVPEEESDKTQENDSYYNKDKETVISETESEEEYDDDAVAEENFYGFSTDGEKRDNLLSNSILRAFKICGGDTYYQSVRSELDDLFNENPTDDALKEIFPYSLWVKIQDGKDKGSLVGVISEHLTVKYVCYAVKKEEGREPPKHSCFVPKSFFVGETEGYYVTFRDADTGEYAEVKGN